jgi:hypothetical protein
LKNIMHFEQVCGLRRHIPICLFSWDFDMCI